MTEALQQEIRTLRSLHNSARDPEGRVFAPLADAYRRAGQIPEAVRLLNDGLARLPDFVPGHVVAAQLYVEQGLAEEAGIAARRALQLDPDNVCALRSLLWVLEQKGESAEAVQVREHLVGLEPDFQSELADVVSVTQAQGGGLPPAEPVAPQTEDAFVLGVMEEPPQEVEAEQEEHGELGGLTLSDEASGFATPLVEGDSDASTEPVFGLDSLPTSAAGVEAHDVVDTEMPSVDEPGSSWVDAGALEDQEPVYDLDELAPDEPLLPMVALAPDEPVLEMADLAPEEPVLGMDALAPDEPVLDVAALAPEEPVVGMDASASDEFVQDVTALAPEEPVLDMAALAPDEPILDVAALAPEEPVLDMAALAPDEPVLDVSALAPDAGSDSSVDDVIDIVLLTPDEPDEIVIDMDVLRPEGFESGSGTEEPLTAWPSDTDEGGGAPSGAPESESAAAERLDDTDAPAGGAPSDDDFDADDGEGEAAEPVYTRTLAELYVKQGAVDRALGVLRHLYDADPSNRDLADRIAQLEEGVDPAIAPPAAHESPSAQRAWRPEDEEEEEDAAHQGGEEVESLARDLAQGDDGGHEVDSPFAWGEQESGSDVAEGPTIREYFDRLLSWEPRKEP